jgi:organic radical activating enzyme
MPDIDPTQHGRLLPLMEDFYSIQGEGFHTGKAAYFLRIGGCDVGCGWCDVKESWNPEFHPLIELDYIVDKVSASKAKTVVLTGGEPLLYNLDLLCDALKTRGYKIHLETSASSPLSGSFDWICLSPKKNAPPFPTLLKLANELKVIISDESDFSWAEENGLSVNEDCYLCLQPEWSRMQKVMPAIVDYVLNNPRWHISLQAHKFMKIP